MLELLALLREHAFRVFLVTGGGVEFVRAVSEELYGVRAGRRRRLGRAARLRAARRPRAARAAGSGARATSNEGPPKAHRDPAAHRPPAVVAAGNSAGDTEMLEYAETGERSALCLVVDHDDAQREHAYPGTAMTNPKAEPIRDTALRRGWTVVSMRDDWARVFADP